MANERIFKLYLSLINHLGLQGELKDTSHALNIITKIKFLRLSDDWNSCGNLKASLYRGKISLCVLKSDIWAKYYMQMNLILTFCFGHCTDAFSLSLCPLNGSTSEGERMLMTPVPYSLLLFHSCCLDHVKGSSKLCCLPAHAQSWAVFSSHGFSRVLSVSSGMPSPRVRQGQGCIFCLWPYAKARQPEETKWREKTLMTDLFFARSSNYYMT